MQAVVIGTDERLGRDLASRLTNVRNWVVRGPAGTAHLGWLADIHVIRRSMGILRKSAATVGFCGDDLDPVEITLSLGAEPTVGVRKGDLMISLRGCR